MIQRPILILLMEDDAGLARLCQRKLEKAGYEVDCATDGEEGLRMYDAHAYDAVVMDHAMPVYDGLEVMRRLAARGALPPIVMVTGAGNERVAVEAMKLGAREYLVKDVDGGYLSLLPTVIERAIHMHRLDEGMRLASKVFQSATEGIVVTDAQGRIMAVNGAFTVITGYAVEEVVGKEPRTLQDRKQDEELYKKVATELAKTGEWQGEVWSRHKDGEAYVAWLAISAVKDDRGRTANYVGFFIDITCRKQAEERLRHLATHDPLTDLPNRDLFQDRLVQALALAGRNKRMTGVLLLDLDHFKIVNDTLGHAYGDQVLRGVAERLTRCVRECDTVARLGGDEFVVFLAEVTDRQGAATLAQRIVDELGKPLSVDGKERVVTASVGVAIYPTDADNPDALLKTADKAMYRAKKSRNCWRFCCEEADRRDGARRASTTTNLPEIA